MISYKEHIKALALLGIPIVIGQLGSIAQAFADTIMVGHYGTDELSAAGFVNNVMNLAIYLLLGFSYSTTPIVGSYIGRKQNGKAAQTLKESMTSNLAFCIVIGLFLLFLYQHLEWLNQPEALLPLIRPYFLIILSSLPFLALFNALKQFCDGTGDTRTPMWIMMGGNGINILGNWVLIFGSPEMSVGSLTFSMAPQGLLGAGYATLISRIAMLVGLAAVVFGSKRYVIFRDGLKQTITRRGLLHLSRTGLPISLQMGLEASSFNIAAIMMGWLGIAALAAHQIMCTVGTFCFLIYYGIGAAAAIRMSHFRGCAMVAADTETAQIMWREVRRTSMSAYAMTATMACLLISLFFVLRTEVIGCFTTSEEVIATCMTMTIPFMLYQLGDMTQTIFANSLRAIEDVKPLMWGAAVAYLIVSLPLSYLFGIAWGGGAAGVWYGFPFGLTTAGLLFLWRFRTFMSRRIRSL